MLRADVDVAAWQTLDLAGLGLTPEACDLALQLPGLNALAGLGYLWVARNRQRLPGGTPACALPAQR